MPDETLIRRIEELLADITRLGGENERTSIVSNLVVVDAAPAGLTNFITIADERDGDTILAKTVPGIIYAVSDKVNVLFVEGTEPIAFQQGSESPSAGLWGIVPSTSTDIFYDNGNVSIAKSTAPATELDVDGDITLANQIIHAGDTDNNIAFTDDVQTYTVGGLVLLTLTEAAQDTIAFGPGSGDIDINFNGDMFLGGSTGNFSVGGAGAPASRFRIEQDTANVVFVFKNSGDTTAIRTCTLQFNHSNAAGATIRAQRASGDADGMKMQFLTEPVGGVQTERMVIESGGDIGVGIANATAQFHIDQASTTAAQPVLKLDQADISEEFIGFIGAAAAATLTQSLVDEGDVTTATRIGFFKVDINDVGNQITDGVYFVPFFSLA